MQRALQIAKAKKWIMVLPDFPKVKFDAPDQKLRGKLHDDATLLKVWAALPDDVREACQVAVATGLRFTELCRLRASWVQAAPEGTDIAAVLVLPREATKSRKARAVGLGAETVKLIKQRAKVHGDQVFPHTSYGQALRRAAKTLGLSKTVTLRDLRHTFASNGLKGSGGNFAAVSKALGHSETETTNLCLHAPLLDVINLAKTVSSEVVRVRSSEETTTKKKGDAKSAKTKTSEERRGRELNPRPTAYETAEGALQEVAAGSSECEIVGDSCVDDSSASPPLAAFRRPFAASLLTPPERMLSAKEAAGRMSVSVATIYKLCARGLLRHVRVLSAIRIPESALDGLSHEK